MTHVNFFSSSWDDCYGALDSKSKQAVDHVCDLLRKGDFNTLERSYDMHMLTVGNLIDSFDIHPFGAKSNLVIIGVMKNDVFTCVSVSGHKELFSDRSFDNAIMHAKEQKGSVHDSANILDMNLKKIKDSRNPKSLREQLKDSIARLKQVLADYRNKLTDAKHVTDAVKKHNDLVDSIKNQIKDCSGNFQEAAPDEPVVDTNIESPTAETPSLDPNADGHVQQGATLTDSKISDSDELDSKIKSVLEKKFSTDFIKRRLEKELCPTFRLLAGNLLISVVRTDPKQSDGSYEMLIEANDEEELLEPSTFYVGTDDDKVAKEIQVKTIEYVLNNDWAKEIVADIYDLYDNSNEPALQ